ncbi:uncharacterized protein LOC135366221 [Ornithodoros turicata]|uniref:uncharacterized protein LOC135366221 n=1 Tax=Ornithodoros turicata TaxID=34597 RepID=UPI0031392694
MVESLAATVATLANRLPPLPAQEVIIDPPSDLEDEDRDGDATPPPPYMQSHSNHLSDSEDQVAPAQDDWLAGLAGVGPREVSPVIVEFVRTHWGADGRAERCRKALADFPRQRLPFLVVPDLNTEMRSLVREATRDRRRFGAQPSDGDSDNVGHRDQVLRDAQASVISAVSPLVSLLERCADLESSPPEGSSGGRVERRVVADHLAAALSHLGRVFSSLGNERRENVLARIAPELRSLVTKDHQPEEDGAARLFGQHFLDQIRTRNETFKVLKEARQPPRQALDEPAAKRSRPTSSSSTSFRRPAAPFPGRPFPGVLQGRASRAPRGRGREWTPTIAKYGQ